MVEKKTSSPASVEVPERDGKIDNFYAIHNRISLSFGARIWELRNEERAMRLLEDTER